MRRLTGFCSVLLFIASLTTSARAERCDALWELYDSTAYKGTLFLDTTNTYWRLRFEIPSGDTTGIRLKGEFPYARYLNFNVYDQKTLDSSTSLPDKAIHPENGNQNPFLEGVDRQTKTRDYVLHIVPRGKKESLSQLKNVIEYPPTAREGESTFVEIWYRIYFPDKGSDKNGNVKLPSIEAFDTVSGNPAACPKERKLIPSFVKTLKNFVPAPKDGDLHFFRNAGAAVYSDPDNHYLTSRLTQFGNWVNVFRFKTPSFAPTYEGKGTFQANTDVRYFSMCVVDVSTFTSECLADAKTQIDKDGYATFVVGPDSLRESVTARGMNFLTRSGLFMPFVIYRNLLTAPAFKGDALKVPQWVSPGLLAPTPSTENYVAHKHIGDYAPKGRYCSLEEFEKDNCGVPFPAN